MAKDHPRHEPSTTRPSGAACCILLADAATLTIELVSPAAVATLGLAVEDLRGRRLTDLAPDVPEAAWSDMTFARPCRLCLHLRSGSGERTAAQATVTRLSGADRDFLHLVLGDGPAGAACEAVPALPAGVATVPPRAGIADVASLMHEISQPLAAIANFGEAARRLVVAAGGPPQAAELMEKSVRQAHVAAHIMRRSEELVAGGREEMQPADLEAVLQEAARLALADAPQRVRLDFDVAPDLPVVVADRASMQRIVFTLVRNARAAMLPSRTPSPRIVVGACRGEGDAVIVSVTDDGPDMQEEGSAEGFRPLRSDDEGARRIDLPPSLAVAEAPGGRLRHEAASGGGARFAFVLEPGAAR